MESCHCAQSTPVFEIYGSVLKFLGPNCRTNSGSQLLCFRFHHTCQNEHILIFSQRDTSVIFKLAITRVFSSRKRCFFTSCRKVTLCRQLRGNCNLCLLSCCKSRGNSNSWASYHDTVPMSFLMLQNCRVVHPAPPCTFNSVYITA